LNRLASRGIRSLKDPGALRPWLYRITRVSVAFDYQHVTNEILGIPPAHGLFAAGMVKNRDYARAKSGQGRIERPRGASELPDEHPLSRLRHVAEPGSRQSSYGVR
jgi:hypothetical protein